MFSATNGVLTWMILHRFKLDLFSGFLRNSMLKIVRVYWNNYLIVLLIQQFVWLLFDFGALNSKVFLIHILHLWMVFDYVLWCERRCENCHVDMAPISIVTMGVMRGITHRYRICAPPQSLQRQVETTSNDCRDLTSIDGRVMVRNASLFDVESRRHLDVYNSVYFCKKFLGKSYKVLSYSDYLDKKYNSWINYISSK